MIYRLIFLSGPLTGSGSRSAVAMTIGRDPECSIVVPDEEVAIQHAVIEHVPRGCASGPRFR